MGVVSLFWFPLFKFLILALVFHLFLFVLFTLTIVYYLKVVFYCFTTVCKWDFFLYWFPLFTRFFHFFCFPPSLRSPPRIIRGPLDILSLIPPHLRVSLPPPYGGPLRPNLPTLTTSNLSVYTTPSSPTTSTSSPCLTKLLRSKPSFSTTSKRAMSFNEPPPRPRSSHRCSHR